MGVESKTAFYGLMRLAVLWVNDINGFMLILIIVHCPTLSMVSDVALVEHFFNICGVFFSAHLGFYIIGIIEGLDWSIPGALKNYPNLTALEEKI